METRRGLPVHLSPKEQVVLEQISDGMTIGQIARALSNGVPTIKTYLNRIFEKLGATNQANAVYLGWRAGVLDLGVNPTRLEDAAFRKQLRPENSGTIGCLIIDEAIGRVVSVKFLKNSFDLPVVDAVISPSVRE